MSDRARRPITARAAHPRRRLLIAAAASALAVAGVIAGPPDANGAATTAGSPAGDLREVTQVPGGVHLAGWAHDPDTTRPISVVVVIDHKRVATATANRGTYHHGTHGFDLQLPVTEGTHRVCMWAANVGPGASAWLRCTTHTFDYGPVGRLNRLTTRPGRIWAQGWTYDDDAPRTPVNVTVTIDGVNHATVASVNRTDVPELTSRTGTAHGFSRTFAVGQGNHHVCVSGHNIGHGSDNTLLCRTLIVDDSPVGAIEPVGAYRGQLRVRGWAYDPDRPTAPLTMDLTVDGTPHVVLADVSRPDVAAVHPGIGSHQGLDVSYPLAEGMHRVCVTARNIGAGRDRAIQCSSATLTFAPTATLYPVAATTTGAHIVGWARDPDTTAPVQVQIAVDGGQPRTVTANATGPHRSGYRFDLTVPLTPGAHNICATAINVGYGTHNSAPSCHTFTYAAPGSAPAAQTTPAPVATSRYIRNIRGSSATELAMMQSEGARDAGANPSGHRYLVLLDIGGQDQYDGGVVLSAGVRFVNYGDLVRDVQAYTTGYHSAQKSGAPVTIAVGTNNDMDVSYASGQTWAQKVVNPIAAHAQGYAGMSIAGANDIEPGFRASYSQTVDWLSGYLAGTTRPFVFNGSADGCAWTTGHAGCNNGWRMAGLYQLAAGASPSRMVNLPQIYNDTMAGQWKYISITGIENGHPRINFGGPLTEWTACAQDGGCGSLTGRTAWSSLWSRLQSDSRTKVTSLPYSTDLRIDR